MKSKHILAIRFSAVGDAAIAVPVLRCLLQQNKNLKVTVATKSFLKPVFETVEGVEVVCADIRGKHKGLNGLLKFYGEIKHQKFTAIADLHGSLRSNVLKTLFLFNGVSSKTIDKGRSEKRKLVSGKMFKPLKTTTERYADVFRALGHKVDLSGDVFPPPQQINAKTYSIVGKDTKKWIGIAPFAFFDTKMYPLDLMEKVIAYLSRTNNYRLILFGGIKEEAELKRLSETYQNTTFTFGKISFEEEIKLISNLDLMVSMDSGNAHLAAMQGVKVITLWGVTHPYAGFYPYKQPESYGLLSNREKYPLIPTSVYGNKAPGGYAAVMRSIPPEKIIQKIEEVIKSQPS
ncbi:glycosyltransferase family 9 protein [Galbibacter pacificus]|uniref:Glycosyltransferase family 9 protein n=1 Tax=Galbibacter pacificus TaxID=2996052 RepID=A0ABT6FUP2_9FLAO|nr:glycosyltransferase family 9 protein [Galbibacter pacificus]MDG3583340.1 glycosyltransferase family 9 protein [Galbibacter pacificus]MDG3586821.1 glycosyltransferase family 9 protein [Galbibacter pacificus]